MNLFHRIIRLPLVVSSSTVKPFINTSVLALGLIGVIKKNPYIKALPAHQPVVKSNPAKIFINFIDVYKNFRDSSVDNEIIWVLKKSIVVIKNLTKMAFIEDSSNAVTDLPHILSGKIEAKHLVPNTTGYVYVLAFSEGSLASLGFIYLLLVRVLSYILFVFIFNKISKIFYNKILDSENISNKNQKFIDVSAKESLNRNQSLPKNQPIYLQNYIKNRNAQ